MDDIGNAWQAHALLMGRVGDAGQVPALFAAAGESIATVARAMGEASMPCALVRMGDGLAIVTRADIGDALALHGRSPHDAVGAIARTPVVSVGEDQSLLKALLLMERHGIRQLVVVDGAGQATGVLQQSRVLVRLSQHSAAIALRIGAATRLHDLTPAFAALQRLIAELHRSGTRIESLARLASDINVALFQRVFQLVMPEAVQRNACLVVMGSEGRGEQVLPTDQDNALVLRDGVEPEGLAAHCQAFSAALADIGYAPCPGRIMLSNPDWVMQETAFRNRLARWLAAADNDSVMNLAIFYDSAAVAGDADMLARLRCFFLDRLGNSDAFYARFASAIAAFAPPLRLFGRLRLERQGPHRGSVDLKKSGIFPVVHGIRSLALEKRLDVTGTHERAATLMEIGSLDRRSGRELLEAFSFLSDLRTACGLAAIASGREADSFADPAALTGLDRDRLRRSLRVVHRFRELVGHHFRLDLLGL
ncbi:MAG: CBS domain-containing protein [Betaproteobacteria bacterium]|nr:CBS domain-containing protein [Betaproteobacteria bacterium]